MNEQPYLIPAESIQFEEEIKKSTFITYLAHTPSIDDAKAFIGPKILGSFSLLPHIA